MSFARYLTTVKVFINFLDKGFLAGDLTAFYQILELPAKRLNEITNTLCVRTLGQRCLVIISYKSYQ